MKIRVWKIVSRIISLAFVFAFVFILASPMTAFAKTKTLKLKPAYPAYPGAPVVEINETVVTINKTGNYKVVQNKSNGTFEGFLVFEAPKTKTYKITLSNLKCKGKELVYGGVVTYFHYEGDDYLTGVNCKTKGTYGMSISSQQRGGSMVKKRVGTIRLEKGQKLYLYYSFIVKTKGKKLTSNLTIK